MSRFKLVPYGLYIQREQGEVPAQLDNIDGQGTDLFKIIDSFLSSIKDAKTLEDLKKTISLETYDKLYGDDKHKERYIHGIIKSGEYGLAADFVDVETCKPVPDVRREINYSEVYPFFFYFYLPRGSTKGILILQIFDVYGIKTILHKSINEYIKIVISQDLNLVMYPLVSKDLVDKINKNRVLEVKFIRYDVPKDPADKVHNGKPEELIEERSFKIRRNRSIKVTQSLKDLIKSVTQNRETPYYAILDETYDAIKIIIDEDGSRKTLTFSDSQKAREYMPLNIEDISIVDGFPVHKDLLKNANIYLNHIKNQIG